MLHPILAQRKVFYPFLAGWFFLIVLQGGFLFYQTLISARAAIIDSLIYNGILMILSLALYFPLAYPDEGDTHGDSAKPLWYHFFHHSATAVITLIIWLGSSFFLTGLLLEQNHSYMEFSRNSLPFRATIGALLMILLIAFYHFLGFYRHFEEKKSREEQLKKLVKEAELKALKAQLNPHFLFNSLNSISSLTISDPPDAREMLTKLSDFLRYSLRNNNESMLPLEDEIKNMKRYLDIEKVRFGERLNTEFHIPVECYNWPIPAMLLQPIYENAIKHGLYESIEPVNIQTSCSIKDGILILSVINNYDPDCTPQKGTGVGLENVRNKLLLFYNRTDLMAINRQNNHFEVRFMLPKTKKL